MTPAGLILSDELSALASSWLACLSATGASLAANETTWPVPGCLSVFPVALQVSWGDDEAFFFIIAESQSSFALA